MPLPNPEELSSVGKFVFGKIESHIANPDINKWASKVFGLQSTLTGDSGEALSKYLRQYEAVRDKHVSIANKAVDEYHANSAAFDANVKAAKPGYDTKYHRTISNMKGQVEPYVLRGSAQMEARNRMFGPHDELLQGHINAIAKEHGALRGAAAGELKAQNVVDALGIYFHDTAFMGQESNVQMSRLSMNLGLKGSQVEDISFAPSKYSAPGDIERAVQRYVTGALAYKAALKHVNTPLNALIGRTLTSAGKALPSLFGTGYEATKAEMLSVNALGQIFHEINQQHFEFQHGVIHTYAPGSFGEFVSKNWMIPGMSFMRQRTAALFSAQGKIAAMELAERLKLPDIKAVERARYDLKRLGIDPDKVKYNGYKLDNNDIRNAMFNNTNDRMHLNSGLYRSSAATGTTTGRLFGQYHAYTAAQSTFLQQEILASVAKGDPMGAIKTIAMLGTIFPMAGAAIGSLSAIWGGKHIDKALDQFKEEAGLEEGHRLAGLIKGFSDTAGFGIIEGYYRSILRNELANQMLGASAATALQGATDALKAAQGYVAGSDKDKGPYKANTYDPVLRDIIHDIPSAGILPLIAGHFDLLPTQQRLNEEKPRTARQTQSLARNKAKRDAAKEARRRF